MCLAPQAAHPPSQASVCITMLARSGVFLDFPLNEQVKVVIPA